MQFINYLIIIIVKNFLYNECFSQDTEKIINHINNHTANIKDIFKKIYNRDSENYWSNLDDSPLLYPKNNLQKLEKIKKQWDNYYDCLEEQHLIYQFTKSIPLIATMSFIGTTVKLECGLCQSPAEAFTSPDWYYSSTYNRSKAVILPENRRYVTSPFTSTLYIFNILPTFAGLYYCNFNYLSGPNYYIHIADEAEPIITVGPETAYKAQQSQKEYHLPHLGIILKTEWTSWTNCNRCGKVGKRMRHGICMVSASYTNATINGINNQLSILYYFKAGIPCRSKLLPKNIFNAKQVKTRPSEIMISFCKVPCNNTNIYDEYDREGKSINSESSYYKLQELLELKPNPEQVTVHVKLNLGIKLICPGSIHEDIPVLWYINETLLYDRNIRNLTHGRITINSLNQIVFQRVKFSDSKVYSCWQGKELAGAIHLIIYEKIEDRLNKVISFLLISVIFTTLFRTFYNAYKTTRIKLN